MGCRVFAAGGLTIIAAVACSSPPATTSSRIHAQSRPAASQPPDQPPPRPSRRINGSPPRTRSRPTVAEVQRAIGVSEDQIRRSGGNPFSSSSSFIDLLSSTPIGQAEGPVERKLREAAEWVADGTEAHAGSVQQIVLVVCLNILPVWIFLLLVASGLVKLPFDLPFLNDLFT